MSYDDDALLQSNHANLDTSWIQDFEQIDKQYDAFYLDDVSFIRLHFVYADKNNEILKVSESKYHLKAPNRLSKEELLGILKKTSFVNDTRFSLLSILKYNFHLLPQNIRYFLIHEETDIDSMTQTIRNIDDVAWQRTIKMFHELNSLYFIFRETSPKREIHNTTKKVFMNLKPVDKKHSKTYRKRV